MRGQQRRPFLFIFITSPLYLAFLLIVFALLGSYLLVSCTPCVSLLILLILIIYVGAIIVIFGYVCSVSSNFVLSLRYSRYSRYGLWLAVFSVLFVIVFKVLNFTSFVLDYSQSIVQVSPGDYFFHRRFVAIFVFIAVLILVLLVVASFSFTSFSTSTFTFTSTATYYPSYCLSSFILLPILINFWFVSAFVCSLLYSFWA